MDKKFLQMMSLTAFSLLSVLGENGVNAAPTPPITSSSAEGEMEEAHKDQDKTKKSHKKAKPSLPATQPPTGAEIEKAYKDCLDHDCTGFAEWSLKAYEVCSNGDDVNNDNDGNACEVARDLLTEIKSPRVAESIYDKEVPHSFKEDDEHTPLEEDDERFIHDIQD